MSGQHHPLICSNSARRLSPLRIKSCFVLQSNGIGGLPMTHYLIARRTSECKANARGRWRAREVVRHRHRQQHPRVRHPRGGANANANAFEAFASRKQLTQKARLGQVSGNLLTGCPHRPGESAVVADGIDPGGAFEMANAIVCVPQVGVCVARTEMEFGEDGLPVFAAKCERFF